MAVTFGDAVDSHYQWVKARILANNPQRLVMGLLNAQDWPNKDIKTEAFYLLVLPEAAGPNESSTASIQRLSHNVQWVWMIAGTDIPASGARKANRGDRYRTQVSMKNELINGLFPYYCEKKSWSLDANGRWIGQSLDPAEAISWTRAQFHDRQDKPSGAVYGSAAVSISNMLDQIVS